MNRKHGGLRLLALVAAGVAVISPFYFFTSSNPDPILDIVKHKQAKDQAKAQESAVVNTTNPPSISTPSTTTSSITTSTNTKHISHTKLGQLTASKEGIVDTKRRAESASAAPVVPVKQDGEATSTSEQAKIDIKPTTNLATQAMQDKDSAFDEQKTEQVKLASAKPKFLSDAKSKLDEGAGVSLQERVDKIYAKRTKKDQEAYEQSLIERKKQVTEAIESISESSKVYRPPLLSDRAIVVYFSVVAAPQGLSSVNSIGAFGSADGQEGNLSTLHKLPLKAQQKIDILSGPTLLGSSQKLVNGTKYLAEYLAKESGASLYNITTVEVYPQSAVKLYEHLFNEYTNHIRPELTDDFVLDLNKYDTIYLCYQNWWDDLPQAFYSFFDKYDFSGKTIIPICVSKDQQMGSTVNTIASLEPNAVVYESSLNISKKEFNDLKQLHEHIRKWLDSLTPDFS